MDFPKQLKDQVYKLLQEPTLDKFRDFLRSQTGEHNAIDFKKEWITGVALAKLMLSLANSQGGIIVFGVDEKEDKSVDICGLNNIRDDAVISNDIKNYISSDLKYVVHNFSYDASEYQALIGKHFQMLVVEDTPEHIPFLAKRDSGNLKQNMIYVRRGTSCEVADQEEIRSILERRMNYMHPLNGEPLRLEQHLLQLKILYENIKKENVYYQDGLSKTLRLITASFSDYIIKGEKVTEPNPLYPDESFEEFVSRLIVAKKKKIERVLDLY